LEQNIEGKYRKMGRNLAHQLDEIDKKGELYGLTREDRATKHAIQDQLREIIEEEGIK
jgi:hypothetical protein